MDNFDRKIIKLPSGCWIWNGSTNQHGYGIYQRPGSPRLAHRISYELHVGPIPDGLIVCHKCDIRPCVNPAHLFVGTQKDNMLDMLHKGRHSRAGRPKRGEANQAARLTESDVMAIRTLYPSMIMREISAKFGVSKNCVWKVLTAKTWTHV